MALAGQFAEWTYMQLIHNKRAYVHFVGTDKNLVNGTGSIVMSESQRTEMLPGGRAQCGTHARIWEREKKDVAASGGGVNYFTLMVGTLAL